jgi:ABC-type antimicrobial peptide transport system permease subunit
MTLPNLLYVNAIDNSITLTSGEVFYFHPIQDIVSDERTQIFFDNNLWDREDYTHYLHEIIIAPMSFMLGGMSRAILAVDFIDGNTNGETLMGIADFLSADMGVEVRFNSLFQRFAAQIDEMAAVLGTVNMILYFCLIVVFIGFVGLVIILYERRKRNIAMSMVCGAFQRQIAAEVLIEVGFVVMSSVGIAAIISVIIQNTLISFREFPFYVNYGFIGIVTLSALVISVIVVAVPLVQIKKLNIPMTLANTN